MAVEVWKGTDLSGMSWQSRSVKASCGLDVSGAAVMERIVSAGTRSYWNGRAVLDRPVKQWLCSEGQRLDWQSRLVQYRNGTARRGRYWIFLSGFDRKGRQ